MHSSVRGVMRAYIRQRVYVCRSMALALRYDAKYILSIVSWQWRTKQNYRISNYYTDEMDSQ